MKMHKFILMFPFPALPLLLLLCGCSTTYLTTKWKDPGLTTPLHFTKVVALAVHEDGTIRRVAEDEMVRQIGPLGVPAYTILSEEDRKDVERIKARLIAAGVDGAVVMKLLGKQTETTYSGGAPAAGYQGAYGWTSITAADSHRDWGASHSNMAVDDPQTNTILVIETRIFSVNDGKMIWSATSHTETFTPENVRQVVSDISQAVTAELRKEQLLAPAQEH